MKAFITRVRFKVPYVRLGTYEYLRFNPGLNELV